MDFNEVNCWATNVAGTAETVGPFALCNLLVYMLSV